jgi:hypothetical protein
VGSEIRGWNLVLFEDRASRHTSPESLEWVHHVKSSYPGTSMSVMIYADPGHRHRVMSRVIILQKDR